MLFREAALIIFVGLGLTLGGCTTFPPEDARVSEINKNSGDYANQAILLNVVRSERFEPLTFVTVTGLDGTSSVQGSLGFGGFNLGPHLLSAPRSFLLGPDAVSRTGSNTFHVSVVDDPASFVALLSPVSSATIAFFTNQGYPRELLFFLFVDRIRVTTPDGASKTYLNDPSRDDRFGPFAGELASLLKAGLTAELDITTVPTGRSLPRSALCFDRSLPLPAFVPPGVAASDTARNKASAAPALPLSDDATCTGATWIVAAATGTPGGESSSGGGAPVSSIVAGRDGSLWLLLADQKKIRHIVPGKPAEDYDVPQAKKAAAKPPLTSFPLRGQDGSKYDVFLRSTLSVYGYLGALRRGSGSGPTDVDNLLELDKAHFGGIVDVTAARSGCFVEVDDAGHFCVPNTSGNTKRLFSLLHQLQELATAPSNSPTTLTVTPVP